MPDDELTRASDYGPVVRNDGTARTWHLIHRPDPDAEAVEALAKVMHDDRCADECCDGCDMGDYEHDAERIIHSARERGWYVVRGAES